MVDVDRIGDTSPPPSVDNFASLANRTADPPLPIPDTLPAQTPRSVQLRHDESSVYPYLETNIKTLPMEFTQEPILPERSPQSVALYRPTTPFRQ